MHFNFNKIIIFISTLSILYSVEHDQSSSKEFNIGWNYPTGVFDKYADDGISFRYTYSKSFKKNGLFKWQGGLQYLRFRRSSYNDEFQMSSGFNGPNVDVVNQEQGYIVNGGFRFTAQNGLFKKGNFRPYIGALAGIAYFKEDTTWDWEQHGTWDENDCDASWLLFILTQEFDCNDYDTMYEINDSRIEPIFTLDFGFNMFFDRKHIKGLDFGIRYNMLTGLKVPETIHNYENSTHSYIIDEIQADYYTIYIGVAFLPFKSRMKKKEEDAQSNKKNPLSGKQI